MVELLPITMEGMVELSSTGCIPTAITLPAGTVLTLFSTALTLLAIHCSQVLRSWRASLGLNKYLTGATSASFIHVTPVAEAHLSKLLAGPVAAAAVVVVHSLCDIFEPIYVVLVRWKSQVHGSL
jgi:hypothetical protein